MSHRIIIDARRLAGALAVGSGLALGGCATEGTGLGLNLVPQEQVQAMGVEAWQQLRAEIPASNNGQYQQTAEQVSDRVLRAMGEDPSQWEVVVFRSDELNAFALPGNKIGVYEGMMDFVDSEAQLAAVIGHEIGHNKANHSVQRVNSEMTTQLGIDIASAALGAYSGTQPQQVAALLGAGAQYGLLLPYSRNQELEADRLGLMYMARAGYDPQAAVEVWQKMAGQGGGRPPTFLSTHPDPEARVDQLQKLMPEAMAAYRRQ